MHTYRAIDLQKRPTFRNIKSQFQAYPLSVETIDIS